MITQELKPVERAVFCADLHLHEHQDYARVLPNGRNSRLDIGVQCWKQAVDLADGGMIVFGGDLFHDRRALQNSVTDAATEAMEYAVERCSSVLLLVGNHDQYLRNGSIHSLRAFKQWPNVYVCDDGPTLWKAGNLHIYAHPFDADSNVPLQWARSLKSPAPDDDAISILLLHQGLRGARMNGGVVDGSSAAPIGLERFNYVLLGHYHKPQVVPGYPHIQYISSPYQLNWGESGDQKRFLMLDGLLQYSEDAGGELHSVPVTDMPEFRRIKLADWQMLSEPTRHYYEVLIPAGVQVDLPPGVVGVPEAADAPAVPLTGATFDVTDAIQRWADEVHPDEEWLVEEAARRVEQL